MLMHHVSYRLEVSFRLPGGTLLQDNSANFTVGEFFSYYCTPARIAQLTQNLPAIKLKTFEKARAVKNGTLIYYLEIYVDVVSVCFSLPYGFSP